ncbi:SGNH hydrolase [Neolentinus lepideus HHB14362 ss-1]|uniref:SGNH hydrolase n=1 Tax=Neolentinus lepideus HHB14362 ss-1 TaxID=1314782 RepID=A0A165VMH7_9AGAM|nr:SGNH hydrolase [Neolentinus lepideus HHB14362 ss-1]
MNANVQDVVVLLGDSITEFGWDPHGLAQRLAQAYARKFDVINRGFAGYNSEWVIPVFEQFFAKSQDQAHLPKVQLLAIWFGANDACFPHEPQHVPLDVFTTNLSKLVNYVKSPDSLYYSPSTRVVLITPPPLYLKQWNEYLAGVGEEPQGRSLDSSHRYAEAVKEVGKKEGVPVVDAWTGIWEAAGKVEEALRKYLKDGLHPNANGYAVVYDGLLKAIGESYPEIHPEALQSVFARFDEVLASQNLSKTLIKRNAFVTK